MKETIAAEARLDDCLVDFGRWRNRLKGQWIAGSILVGIALGLPGYMLARWVQFAVWNLNWLWLSAAIGVGIPFLVMVSIGAAMAQQAVSARTPAAIRRIAARHQVEEGQLTELADLVGSLDSTANLVGGVVNELMNSGIERRRNPS